MTQARVAILISGSGSNMLSLADAMAAPDYPGTVTAVISNRADAPGLAKAADKGLQTFHIPSQGRSRDAFEQDLEAVLTETNAEVICLAGFMRILSPDFVAARAGKILNIHPSLLPLFKGLNTHAQALAAGVAIHGATVHIVTANLDDGPILGQAVVPIEPGDTEQALATRTLAMEHRLYPEALRRYLSGKPTPFAMLQ